MSGNPDRPVGRFVIVCGMAFSMLILGSVPERSLAITPPDAPDSADAAATVETAEQSGIPHDAPPVGHLIPGGPRGAAIREGQRLVSDTARALPQWVGSGLSCSNCHLGGGTVARASPWVGIWGMFPEYRSRSGKMISLEERINDCMQRSMNGTPLPYDSAAMNAILSYIQWLSEGTVTGTSPPRGFGPITSSLKPDGERGAQVYAARCVACHGAGGAGLRQPDGTYQFPAVWGAASFNIGAGMARTFTAAAFIRHNMPLGNPDSLSEQEAVDVAEYVTHQPRPEFLPRKRDWPKGDAPIDARLN